MSAVEVLARSRCERHWRTPCDMSGCAEFGCEWRKGAEVDLSALSAAGWAVVPREPTEAMCSKGADELPTPTCESTDEEAAAEVYRAMLAAGEAHDDGR